MLVLRCNGTGNCDDDDDDDDDTMTTTTTNPRGLAALDASTFTSGLAFLPSVFAFGGVNGNEGGICRQTLANDPTTRNRANRDSSIRIH